MILAVNLDLTSANAAITLGYKATNSTYCKCNTSSQKLAQRPEWMMLLRLVGNVLRHSHPPPATDKMITKN
jgi:hypothetical protein